MTLDEALKRTDEDEELWAVTSPVFWSQIGDYFLAERRDQIIRCNADGSTGAVEASGYISDEAAKLMVKYLWFLVRIRNGRWERVE